MFVKWFNSSFIH